MCWVGTNSALTTTLPSRLPAHSLSTASICFWEKAKLSSAPISAFSDMPGGHRKSSPRLAVFSNDSVYYFRRRRWHGQVDATPGPRRVPIGKWKILPLDAGARRNLSGKIDPPSPSRGRQAAHRLTDGIVSLFG